MVQIFMIHSFILSSPVQYQMCSRSKFILSLPSKPHFLVLSGSRQAQSLLYNIIYHELTSNNHANVDNASASASEEGWDAALGIDFLYNSKEPLST
mmetsp:Transcript_36100/g.79042  ORF Transcript_36100/g.79042 Transcript_36100/m.79042 type:complete len:96 (-) Transcript_36100:868-1155(-)